MATKIMANGAVQERLAFEQLISDVDALLDGAHQGRVARLWESGKQALLSFCVNRHGILKFGYRKPNY
jgi:hypothetical protein